MKQITKTPEIIARMKAAFGPDVAVETLPVFEAVALNTLPLRKSSGLFKGARITASTLPIIAAQINAESAPLQVQHDTGTLPFGRMFYASVNSNDEMRALFTCTDPKLVSEIDNGTIDQTSVQFLPKHINCSACGFDYRAPDAWENRYTLTCDNGHTLGEDGVFAWLDGCESFHEYSLVGKGAANGARIVGPSEAQLSANEKFKLAASASPDGFGIVQLTATQEEPTNVDTAALMASYTTAVKAEAELTVKLAAETVAKTAAETRATTAEAALAEANAKLTAIGNADTVVAELAALREGEAETIVALKAEATKILTALGKTSEPVKETVKDLLAQIEEHRAALAAYVPAGGRSNATDKVETTLAASAPVAAFTTRK